MAEPVCERQRDTHRQVESPDSPVVTWLPSEEIRLLVYQRKSHPHIGLLRLVDASFEAL